MRTDHRIPARRPDIVVLDKKTKMAHIIDVAVPTDSNIKEKELEKIQKYQDLKLEVQKMWKVQAPIVPVEIGALGATLAELEKHLDNIPGEHKIGSLLKPALLGSAHILRKVLNLPEIW